MHPNEDLVFVWGNICSKKPNVKDATEWFIRRSDVVPVGTVTIVMKCVIFILVLQVSTDLV